MERYLNKKYRKLEQIVKQTIRLSEKDGKYQFETFWPMTSSSAVFRPGVPFDELRIDGVIAESLIEFKDNKMIHTQTVKGVQTTFVREYSDKQVNMTITCGDIVASRVYARVY